MKPSKKAIEVDSNLGQQYRAKQAGKYSLAQIKKMYAPARTLGASEEIQLACDHALEDAGVYGLLQHSINLGQMPLSSFMGYGALQQMCQNALIRTCISTLCKDMIRAGFKLSLDKRNSDFVGTTEEDVANIAAIEDSYSKYEIDKLLKKALELDGYEGGSFIFIDTGAKGAELRLPLTIDDKSEELHHYRPLKFKIIDPINCFPGNYNASNPLDDGYFDPETYFVLGIEVHKSRLIRFVSNEVPILLKPAYNFLGIPQAQLLWDYVIHFNENRNSVNTLLNKFSLTAFKTNMSDVLTGGAASDLNRRMDYLAEKRDNSSILLMDKESEDIINISTPISGVTDIVKQSLEMLAVVSHIPAVILFGQSPQGFNATGESDILNYANYIETLREEMLRRPLNIILEVIRIHDTYCTDSVQFEFNKFDTSRQSIEAMTKKTEADTYALYLQAGVLSVEEVRQKIASDQQLGLSFIDVEEIPENNLGDDFLLNAEEENQDINSPTG